MTTESETEEPIFKIGGSRVYSIVMGFLLIFFGYYLIISPLRTVFYPASIIIMALLGVFFAVTFLNNTFYFYENFFTMKYLGRVRYKIDYSQITSCDVQKFRSRTMIAIWAKHGEKEIPFPIRGNPKSKMSDLHLYDWLKTKIHLSE